MEFDRFVSRRDMLRGAAVLAVGALAGCSSDTSNRADAPSGPSKGNAAGSTTSPSGSAGATTTTARLSGRDAPFDTVVVLMMENRSFDHLLGWLPGADGKQAGLRYRDVNGVEQATFALGADDQGCKYADPAHDWKSVATQYADGKGDGWLQTAAAGDLFPIGYYTDAELPIMSVLARNHTVFDRYFCSVLGPTWPNRLYQWCATTDLDASGLFPGPDQERPSKLELSIFDRLAEAGLSAGYYYASEPMSGLFASKKYDAIAHPTADFFAAAKAGTLPNVTYLDPEYGTIPEIIGTSNDYHPHGSIKQGEKFVADVYQALAASPQWERMVIVLNFDEHGGFYDHVVPPSVADDTVWPTPAPPVTAPAARPDLTKLGFRVPCIAMGPYAPARIEQGGPYEHCSVLRMIEWRWNLEPMTRRDREAANLADALDFSARRAPVALPAFDPGPPVQCPPK